VRVINDAAMQGLGSYRGGRMLFIGLGTGFGSALVWNGVVLPLELSELPYLAKGTIEDRVGKTGLKQIGRKNWEEDVERIFRQPFTMVASDAGVQDINSASIPHPRGFGNNARAALITRGLAETGRLSTALGGRRDTLMGLAGLGDLVLTCSGDLSRNRRVGVALAHDRPLDQILAELGHVAEGVASAAAVRTLSRHHGVEMPICDAVHAVLYEGLPARRAVERLLSREPRSERS